MAERIEEAKEQDILRASSEYRQVEELKEENQKLREELLRLKEGMDKSDARMIAQAESCYQIQEDRTYSIIVTLNPGLPTALKSGRIVTGVTLGQARFQIAEWRKMRVKELIIANLLARGK